MYYFGFYKDLLELNIPNSVSQDIYEKSMARYYNEITARDRHDIEVFLKNASVVGGSVLELACGSGRVTIPLAEKGFQVTGIDLSADMLEILDEKLSKSSNRVRKRITTYQCDMTDFSLDQKFKLAILPASSISLLLEDMQISSMFRCVFTHLESGGRFVFDYREPDSIINNPEKHKTYCCTWDHDEYGKAFLLSSEFIDLSKSRFYINLYAEVVKDSVTNRLFGSSEKRLIDDNIIDLAIAEGFHLLDKFTHACSSAVIEKFVILEKR